MPEHYFGISDEQSRMVQRASEAIDIRFPGEDELAAIARSGAFGLATTVDKHRKQALGQLVSRWKKAVQDEREAYALLAGGIAAMQDEVSLYSIARDYEINLQTVRKMAGKRVGGKRRNG